MHNQEMLYYDYSVAFSSILRSWWVGVTNTFVLNCLIGISESSAKYGMLAREGESVDSL